LATSHVSRACDDIGGTVKQLVARVSLQRSYNDWLMKPHQLFDWACSNIPTGYFGYDINGDYVREQISLGHQF